MGWTRPKQLVIPQVWDTFQAKDVDSDQLVTYRVEDLTEDRYEDAIQHFVENYLDDEPLHKNRKFSEDELSVAEVKDFWQWCFDQKMTIVCYKEGSREIVGVNLLHVKGFDKMHDSEVRQTKSEHLKDIEATHEYMTDQFQVCQHYNVIFYLTSYGLAINRRYRGREIATEMLRSRIPLCKTLEIKVTATDFTALGSQLAAAKAGFQTIVEVTYDDFSKMGPRYSYPGIKSKSLKLMSLEIE
ncbi:uncharacterized protein LOC128732724 [Sabethes cyaneus]|uniref:uncharacterized protein LOC128732724 n=1 Tax=Sabethes cyaneus TaxID=53552 RepID=UPI00237D88B8|nr:uncharacterized protein LOC128732724 [Sabethes cyaneus]